MLFSNVIYLLFEADQKEITWWAMSVRVIIIFFLAIALIKVGGKRMFGKQGAFDIVISIMLGTILARAITGNSPFIPTIIAAFVLSLLHKTIAILTFHNKKIGRIVKGKSALLVKDGIMIYDALKKHNITDRDLHEALRSEGKVLHISDVKEAHLERSGKISVIPK
jgi:uncharacterized membrane protein YcaP (DUF421 family)